MPESSENLCKIQALCQSCAYVNQDYETGLKAKFDRALAHLQSQLPDKNLRVRAPKAAPLKLGYRNHAKLAVRRPPPGSLSRFAIGLFAPASHEVVELDHCPVQRASINALIGDLRALLEVSPLEPFSEADQSGDLRYLAIRSSHRTPELMLSFVMTSARFKRELKNLTLELRRRGHNLGASFINVHDGNSNYIFGSELLPLTPGNSLRERLCDLDFELGPLSFFQVNPTQAEIIYRRVEELCGPASEKMVGWDLYSGAGILGLLLGRLGYRTLGIEENPEAVAFAELNAQRNGLSKKLQFKAASVEEGLSKLPRWAREPHTIVMNPARTGLEAHALEHIANVALGSSRPKLIYMSCELKTLARDLKVFSDRGLRVLQIEAFDMFPHTEKLEWLAVIGS